MRIILLLLFLASSICAKELLPDAFKYTSVKEVLSSTIDSDVSLINSKGESVLVSDYLGEKPLIINFAYFTCPKLCHLVVSGMVDALNLLPSKTISDVRILTISFDHRETLESTKAFQESYKHRLTSFSSSIPYSDWHFLYGDSDNVFKLADSMGYRYNFNDKSNQFSHPSVLIFISPEGKVSRYLNGIMFDPTDIKLSILEAKKNKFLSTIESMVLFCYNYDPNEKGYVLEAVKLMKIGGALTVICISLLIYSLSRNKIKYKK